MARRSAAGPLLHNLDIQDSSGASKFKGDFVTGPNKGTYNVSALDAGTYKFICDILGHENMVGEFIVE